MSTTPITSRTNRPGPCRRCPPCPACGDDAMRQYGAKHHGVVHRYFYACQTCQHTDVWREIDGGEVKYWETLRVPLAEPRYEQARFSVKPQKSADKQQPSQMQGYDHLYELCLRGDVHEIRACLKREYGLGGEVIPIIKGLVAVAMQRLPFALDSAQ